MANGILEKVGKIKIRSHRFQTGFSGNAIALIVLYTGGVMVSDNSLTVGSLASFLLYAAYIGVSISGISSFYTELNKGLGASTRLWELMDRQPVIPYSGEPCSYDSISQVYLSILTDIVVPVYQVEPLNSMYRWTHPTSRCFRWNRVQIGELLLPESPGTFGLGRHESLPQAGNRHGHRGIQRFRQNHAKLPAPGSPPAKNRRHFPGLVQNWRPERVLAERRHRDSIAGL